MYVGTGCFYCLLLFTFIQAKTIFLCIVRHKKSTSNYHKLKDTIKYCLIVFFFFLASVYELELALRVFICSVIAGHVAYNQPELRDRVT